MPDLLDKPIVATDEARDEAGRVKSLVFKKLRAGESIVLHFSGHGGSTERVAISGDLGRKIEEFLDALARGHVVFISDQELGLAEVADLLNVEEAGVLKLLDAGELHASRQQNNPRFLRSAVLEYKRKNREARLKVLEELVEEGQKLNPEY